MKKITLLSTLVLFTAMHTFAQNDPAQALPYAQIPEYPESYSAATVAARMVDALGFRYYWATDSLREEDLAYRPSPDARTTGETVDHILGLTRMILNAAAKRENVRPDPSPALTFAETRRATLESLEEASELLKSGNDAAMEDMQIVSRRGDTRTAFPFWNILNGPLADAMYHTGQIVSFRRASGNPMNPKVNVFLGNVRE